MAGASWKQGGTVSVLIFTTTVLIESMTALKTFERQSGLLCQRLVVYKNYFSELYQLDPWKKYGPPPEPRLTFTLNTGHLSSPPLQVVA